MLEVRDGVPNCRVCQESIPDPDSGMLCNYCGQEFHFARSTRSAAPDCGIYHFDPDGVALVFMCQVCLVEVGPPDGP